MNPETTRMKSVMLAAQQHGMTLFRNNVGGAWSPNGHWISFGLCAGSSDLIGWRTVEITPEMVGTRIAQFCAVEVKQPGRTPSDDQDRFLKRVQEDGGLARWVTGAEGLIEGVGRE